MKKKLKLNQLELTSFITENTPKINGGELKSLSPLEFCSVPTNNDCGNSIDNSGPIQCLVTGYMDQNCYIRTYNNVC